MSAPDAVPGNALLAAALGYAARGWLVLPLHSLEAGVCTCGSPKCSKQGKHPRIKTARGHSAATKDPDQIRRWWKRWPSANVGIRTGAESGLVVLDIDPRHGGEASLSALLKGSELPLTPTVRTGGGGQHLCFAHPGREIRNAVGFRPGLDLRADGGLIVAPPSLHASGNRYCWIDGSERGGVPLAPLPVWLLMALEKPRRNLRREVTGASVVRTAGEATPWAEAALRDECEAVAHAPEGTRNGTLNLAAFNVGQLVPHLLRRERVETELLAAATTCRLVKDDGEDDVRATIKSGLEAGMQTPRMPPDRAPPGPSGRVPLESEPGAALSQNPNPTDMGNAERLAAQHCGELRYCHAWRVWMVRDGRRWTRDRSGEAVRRAEETVRSIYAEASTLGDQKERQKFATHAMNSEAQRRIVAMLELAKSDRRIAVLPELFDRDDTRYLLNVLNGTLDLRTGALREHRPDDYITKLAPVEFDPQAQCPLWDGFLSRVLPDDEVRGFLQRFMGYVLTGDTSEQVFVQFFGLGANGKSTYLETAKAMLGDYAHKADFETFLEARASKDRKGAPRADIIALAGLRLVIAVEGGEGRRLDVNTIKEVTGQDTLTARGVYDKDETSFRPHAKLILATNHRPVIRDATEAIWRRLLEVPFTVTIPELERDTSLADRLRDPKELSGILNWALSGCLDWQANSTPRLRPPDAVRRATYSYRDDQDAIAPFLTARVVVDPRGRVTNKDLRAAYSTWCQESEEEPVSERVFSCALEEHGFRRERGKDKNRTRGWAGMRLANMFDGPVSDGSDACAGS